MRRLLTATAVTALLAPGVATAVRPVAPAFPAVRQDAFGDAVHRLREAVRSNDVTAAENAYADAVFAGLDIPVRAQSFVQSDFVAAPVGDVDGDRAPDVVEISRSYDIGTSRNDPATASQVRLRRGRDGRVAWEVGVDGFAGARRIRVGQAGTPGVLVVSGDWDYPAGAVGAPFSSVTTTIAAYDGRGKRLWSRAYTGYMVASLAGWVEATFPFVAGVYDVLPGVADDVLVGQTSYNFPPVANLTTLHVIDGASGVPTSAYTVEVAADDLSGATPIPDLDGDGLGDIVFATGTRAGRGRAAAYRASDGHQLWKNLDLPVGMFSDQVPVGDADGDGVTDIAVPSTAGTVPVLSGRDGRVLWSAPVPKPAAESHEIHAVALGDVDRDRKADLAVVVTTELWWSKSYVAAVTASGTGGRVIYTGTETMKVAEDTGARVYVTAADVQGDGVADLSYSVGADRHSWNGKPPAAGRVVDGRTGRVLHRRPAGITTMTTLDGRGTDFLELMSPRKNELRITAYDGATGRQLWRTSFRSSARLGFAFPKAEGQLTPDRCGDVIVGVGFDQQATAALLVLGGRDGRRLWSRNVVDGNERPVTGLSYGADTNPGC